jgi:hypothetical protein
MKHIILTLLLTLSLASCVTKRTVIEHEKVRVPEREVVVPR